MLRSKLYRSLAIACIAGAILLNAGCEDMGKQHATMKQEQYNRWNATRVGVMYQLAQQQYEVGDYEKCRKTLDEAFALKTPSAPLHVLAAKVDIEKGSLESAGEHLKEATRVDPALPEPFYLLGVVYQRWQKNDVAADYYQQAWDRKPGEALYLLAVVEMKISLGQLDEAQKVLEGKLVYFEQSAALRIALARIAGLKNDHATACRYYRDAVILLPDDQKIRRSYSEELYFAGKYADAVSIFEDMRKDEKVPDKENLLLMLSDAYSHVRRPLDARNCLQEVVRENPNNMVAYLMLSKTCIETNDLAIAVAAVHKVLRSEPENIKALTVSALIQQKQRNWADSRVTLEKALKLAPEDTTVLCMLGIASEQLGKKDEAVAFYQKAIDTDPKDNWATELMDKAKAQSRTEPTAPGEQHVPAAAVEEVAPKQVTAAGSGSDAQPDAP